MATEIQKKKALRFKMESHSKKQLQDRINEHVSRGAKQVSEIIKYQTYKKHFAPTGYKGAKMKFDSHTDDTRYKVIMEISR